MQFPTWKKLLSHLWEIHLESTSSDHNEELHVSLRRGRIQLSTANAIYSYGDLYANFAETFAQFQFESYPLKDVLILGLGLGSIPYQLERIYDQHYHYTAIELDEVIVELAHDYVLADLTSPVETICANALVAVPQLTPASYDLICVDIFEDDKVPAAFETEAFLRNCQKLLRPSGTLLFNRLAYTEQDRVASETFYKGVFQKIFPEGLLLPVAKNYMLLSNAEVVKG